MIAPSRETERLACVVAPAPVRDDVVDSACGLNALSHFLTRSIDGRVQLITIAHNEGINVSLVTFVDFHRRYGRSWRNWNGRFHGHTKAL